MQANPAPPPAMIRNPNLQLAVFLQLSCGGQAFAVQIFDVNPADTSQGTFQMGQSTVYRLQAATVNPFSMSMAAVDTQGRSLRLGAPNKVVNERTQATVVIAAPPMHVDYITPVLAAAPEVLNLSAIP